VAPQRHEYLADMMNLFDLTGRAAAVIGSAQGMGRSMALALAEAGADLVLLDRNAAGIEGRAQSIVELGRKAFQRTVAALPRSCGKPVSARLLSGAGRNA
jgi:NAD(P)-dependent dehydrogenase (short-subunit alcohol dehydrogenase family)